MTINQVFNKDEGLVVLPTDFKEIENQLNSIKYETLRSEQAQQQEQQKRDDLVVYLDASDFDHRVFVVVER